MNDAFIQLEGLVQNLDNTLFYISNISRTKSEEEVKYAQLAMYNLSSFKDEIQIQLNLEKDLKFIKLRGRL